MSMKVLGQEEIDGSTNAIDTDITLYTVPADTTTITSSLAITNRSGAARDVRVNVVVSGDSVADKNYYVYDMALPTDGTVIEGMRGYTLGAADLVSVYCSGVDVNFQLFGEEK